MDGRSDHEVLVPRAGRRWCCYCYVAAAASMQLPDWGLLHFPFRNHAISIFAEPVRMLSATYNQNALPTMFATTSDTSSSANDLSIHWRKWGGNRSHVLHVLTDHPHFWYTSVPGIARISYWRAMRCRHPATPVGSRLARRHCKVIVTKLRLQLLGSHKTVGMMRNHDESICFSPGKMQNDLTCQLYK